MIASKVICDDTYSNKSWSMSRRECLPCERSTRWSARCATISIGTHCRQPDIGQLRGHGPAGFSSRFQRALSDIFIAYGVEARAKAAASASNTPIPEPNSTTSPIPSFGQQRQATPTKPYPAPPPPIVPPPPLYKKSSSSPMTPDTPTHSHSNSTSPASSISPPTPTGPVDLTAAIHDPKSHYETSPGLSLSSEFVPTHPLKSKMFAFAIPA
ncbi:hypothetical protein K438DRAFT_1844095, partial [Mycena galopus ATCC 62051]